MYIAILCDVPAFAYSHQNYNVVSDLMFIEHPMGCMELSPIRSASLFKDWTDMEMAMLYKNTTGEETKHKGDQLRALLVELADRWQEFEGDINCLTKQAAWVANKYREDGNASAQKLIGRPAYMFVDGANVPALRKDVENQTKSKKPKLIKLTAEDISAVLNRPRHIVTAPIRTESTTWPQGKPMAPTATKAAPSKPATTSKASKTKANTPKRASGGKGGLCGPEGTIFKAAEVAWVAAGKPKDANAIKALRKEVAASLVAQGTNKTTAGVQLLAWVKHKGL